MITLQLFKFVISLFNFFVQGYLLQYWIEFFQLQSFRGIFFVLFGDVATCTCFTAGLMLCTLQNNLYPIAFLCHCY